MPDQQANANLIWTPVKKQNIQLTITERGEIESVNNVDIICNVKVGRSSRGPTIRWLVDPGTRVKKGDILMLLEDSVFQSELLDQEIVLKRAENDYELAEQQLKVVQAQNKSALIVKKLAVTTAEITLEKYEKGELSRNRKELDGQRLLARAEVDRWEQRVSFARRMVRRGSYSQAQLEAEEDSLRSAQVTLEGLDENYRVLTDYDEELQRVTFQSLVKQAESELDAAETEAEATERQAKNDRDTKQAVYRQEKAKYDEIQEEIENCKIRAPQSGLLVYYESAQSRRSAESAKIEVGASVHEGQKLLQIPDLRSMQVRTKVHEALVAHVRGEQFRKTGLSESLRIGSLLQPHLSSKLLSVMGTSAIKQDPDADWFRKMDQIKIFNGQRAMIRADAFPGDMLSGRVRSVKNVATKQWYSDVRTYETVVEIDESSLPVNPKTKQPRLKPGMSARVMIFTDRRAENVLAVPVQAVFREAVNKQIQHFVYVKGANGPEKRRVEVGVHNEKLVEIKSGLREGDPVAENPNAMQKDGKGNPIGVEGAKGKGKQSGGPGKGGRRPGK